jgi:hypothetical protein
VDNKAKRDLQKETARSSDFDGKLGIDASGRETTGRSTHSIDHPRFTMQAKAAIR